MFRPNYYSLNEVVEYEMVQMPDGAWYARAYSVIGYRRFINGNEVDDDGTPKRFGETQEAGES